MDSDLHNQVGDEVAPAAGIAVETDIAKEASAALDRFGALLRAPANLDVMLQGVCGQVVATMSSADMAAVTVLSARSNEPRTVACTDEQALDVDIDQYRANEGPCLEAARTGQVVRVRISDAAHRWPDFAKNVSGIGVASYLSAPLSIDDRHAGALNLYSRSDHGFSDIDEVLLRVFVTAIEGALWNARRAEAWRKEVTGVREAIKGRATIEQAKGMLMALRGVTDQQAFQILATQSQSQNVKLAVLAAELVRSVSTTEGRQKPPPL